MTGSGAIDLFWRLPYLQWASLESLQQKCRLSSCALCSRWTHFYKSPLAAEGRAFFNVRIFCPTFWSSSCSSFPFHQYPRIKHVFHGWDTFNNSKVMHPEVQWFIYRTCTEFLQKEASFTCCVQQFICVCGSIIYITWRQAVACLHCCVKKQGMVMLHSEVWLHLFQALFNLFSCRTPATAAAKL